MKPSASEASRTPAAGLPERNAWQALTHDELERQYNARATVADVGVFLAQYRSASDAARAQCPDVRTLAYGDHPDEVLDIFPVPGQALAPVFVFVHGGYWRALGREDSSFMATALRRQGIATVAIHYTLAPLARLQDIVAQCRRSLLWLHAQGAKHGLDASRMVLSGSSAGAHLAAMMLCEDWLRGTTLPNPVVRGAVLASGLYDLQPVRLCQPNQWLGLNPEEAEAMSPLNHLPPAGTKVQMVVAQADTLEFKRQSQIYGAWASAAGCSVQSMEVAGRNHFDVILDWMDSDSALMRATLDLMAPASTG